MKLMKRKLLINKTSELQHASS